MKNWITFSKMEDASMFDVYVTGFYLTTATIVTVGFGDIPFFTYYDKLTAIVLMLLGNITFSLLQGHFQSIISSLDHVQSEYLIELNIIRDMKQTFNLSTELVNHMMRALRTNKTKKS